MSENSDDENEIYETLYWYDGPQAIKLKEKRNCKLVIAVAVDYEAKTWPMFATSITEEMWTEYEARKRDFRSLFTEGTDHCSIDLCDDPLVWTPALVREDVLPGGGLMHYYTEGPLPPNSEKENGSTN